MRKYNVSITKFRAEKQYRDSTGLSCPQYWFAGAAPMKDCTLGSMNNRNFLSLHSEDCESETKVLAGLPLNVLESHQHGIIINTYITQTGRRGGKCVCKKTGADQK